jgi:beta-glucosidase
LNEYETNRAGSQGFGGGFGGGGAPGGVTTGTTTTVSSDDSYSVNIGDKALHETYLAPFYETVKNGLGGAMCSMNRVNDSYVCETQELLATYLKVELGFPGLGRPFL